MTIKKNHDALYAFGVMGFCFFCVSIFEIRKNHILVPQQFGFRKRKSSSDAILSLINGIRDAFEKRTKNMGVLHTLPQHSTVLTMKYC